MLSSTFGRQGLLSSVCFALVLVSAGDVRAQDPRPGVAGETTQAATGGPEQKKPPPELRGQSQGAPLFRKDVDQVVLYAAVYDENGELVAGLQQKDFTVFEDKVKEGITYFGRYDVPSTSGIVMDTSGSMRNKIDLVGKAAKLFVSRNHPENELFLITFDHKVALEEDYTRDSEDIHDALDNITVSGGTALYDAVYLAIDKAQNGSEPKKVIVIFTDGEDRDSYYTHEELLEKIRQSDVQVFMIAILDPDLSDEGGFFGVFKSKRHKVKKKIEEIAENTGGKVYFPEKIQELEDVFQQIALELRNQYRLAYITHNPLKNGSWRTITVEVRDAKQKKLSVRAKKGYFPAGPESPAEDDATQN